MEPVALLDLSGLASTQSRPWLTGSVLVRYTAPTPEDCWMYRVTDSVFPPETAVRVSFQGAFLPHREIRFKRSPL